MVSTVVRPLPAARSHTARTVTYAVLGVTLSASIIVAFNHRKANASIVQSSYFAVRKDSVALSLLGPNIRHRDTYPWIHGEINQNRGNIDFSYALKGDDGEGTLHFRCVRRSRSDRDWEIIDWSILLPDGRRVRLSDDAIPSTV
ncbi:hypothetical protein PYCC9005_001658 [Savitreella phatthalungensis]